MTNTKSPLSLLTVAGLAACLFLVSACSGDESVKVTSLQKKDKHLSCDEIMLEINEAEFYRKTAQGNKSPKISTLLMPLGYISTYMDAEEAVGAADARVDYLNRIYDILRCDEYEQARDRRRPPYSDYPRLSGGQEPSNIRYLPQSSLRHAPAGVAGGGIKEDWYW